jgi:methionyl-tRNA formyltransferase
MRIIFMGTPASAVPSLRRCLTDGHEIVAVWTQPDKPAGRGNKIQVSPVKEFALGHGLAIRQPAKIRNDEAKAAFAAHQAELAVVVAYGKILPREFLEAPKYGCVNVHFSLLPKYRGAAPVNWAIVNGESETGVTTMHIVEQLDAGPMLLQRSTPIGAHENAIDLMSRLAETGADALSETLSRLKEIQPQPQCDSEATFAPILKRQDGLIDWSMDAFAIERRIRGFKPWPEAFTMLNSRRLVIQEATPQKSADAGVAPAQITAAQGDNFCVQCGAGTSLRIQSVQPESKRPMLARDFINGARIKPGNVLGT